MFGKNRQVMNPDRNDTESNAGSVTANQFNRQERHENEATLRKGITTEELGEPSRAAVSEQKSD